MVSRRDRLVIVKKREKKKREKKRKKRLLPWRGIEPAKPVPGNKSFCGILDRHRIGA